MSSVNASATAPSALTARPSSTPAAPATSSTPIDRYRSQVFEVGGGRIADWPVSLLTPAPMKATASRIDSAMVETGT